VLALVVGLALAVWGLLRLRAVPRARPDHSRDDYVGEAPRAPSPHAGTHALPQTISRDAVRRSYTFASRAPGPLCERAFESIRRRTRARTGARAFMPVFRFSWHRLRAPDFMRMIVLRA
jgi:hypothetical protein